MRSLLEIVPVRRLFPITLGLLAAACAAPPSHQAAQYANDPYQPGPKCSAAITAFTSDGRYAALINNLYSNLEFSNQSNWPVDAAKAVQRKVMLHTSLSAVGNIDAAGKLTLLRNVWWGNDNQCQSLSVSAELMTPYGGNRTLWKRDKLLLSDTIPHQVVALRSFGRPMKFHAAALTLAGDGLEYQFMLAPGSYAGRYYEWVGGLSVSVVNRGAGFAHIRKLAVYVGDKVTVLSPSTPIDLAPGVASKAQIFAGALPALRGNSGANFWYAGPTDQAMADAALNSTLSIALVPDADVAGKPARRVAGDAKVASFVDGYDTEL